MATPGPHPSTLGNNVKKPSTSSVETEMLGGAPKETNSAGKSIKP